MPASESSDHRLWAITPLDGRYQSKLQDLGKVVSEGALMARRLEVEAAWLLHLGDNEQHTEVVKLSGAVRDKLIELVEQGGDTYVDRVKEIEQTTNHDVKAVEYTLREILTEVEGGKEALPFIHFGCTSEDINNTAYGLMLKHLREQVLVPQMRQMTDWLARQAEAYCDVPMLSRTHGQAASPTTLGKELAVFGHRLERQISRLEAVEILAKFNGAVGNFNAHLSAFPEVNWTGLAEEFISYRLGLTYNPYTTQIENHDGLAEYWGTVQLHNTILIDLCRDLWQYISLGYFKQKVIKGEVGSSTMPHKVNPIDFENAEGNLGLAGSLIEHFRAKLPISRLQRDLSDSTVQRSIGTIAAHSVLAYKMILRGFEKLDLVPARLSEDLNAAYEVLAEPIQTVMRKRGIANAYEVLKEKTRGKPVTAASLQKLIGELEGLTDDDRKTLAEMTPASYTGLAKTLATQFAETYNNTL